MTGVVPASQLPGIVSDLKASDLTQELLFIEYTTHDIPDADISL